MKMYCATGHENIKHATRHNCVQVDGWVQKQKSHYHM